MDRFGMNVHGDAASHLDALCHVIFDGQLYNGVSADEITSDGAQSESVEIAKDGIVGRGVLLDIPRLRGVPWLEPGDHVTADELAWPRRPRASGSAGATCCSSGSGTAGAARSWVPGTPRPAGPDCIPPRWSSWPTARLPCWAATATTTPRPAPRTAWTSRCTCWPSTPLACTCWTTSSSPRLVPLCERAGRWTFLCVIAPLRLPGGTGSPVNPIAIL